MMHIMINKENIQ